MSNSKINHETYNRMSMLSILLAQLNVCVSMCCKSFCRGHTNEAYTLFFTPHSWILTYNEYKSLVLNVPSIWLLIIVHWWCWCDCYCYQAITYQPFSFVFHTHLNVTISFHFLSFGRLVFACVILRNMHWK